MAKPTTAQQVKITNTLVVIGSASRASPRQVAYPPTALGWYFGEFEVKRFWGVTTGLAAAGGSRLGRCGTTLCLPVEHPHPAFLRLVHIIASKTKVREARVRDVAW